MKRFLATLMLILCLSFPASAGHVQSTGAWCECGSFEECICDPGELPSAKSKTVSDAKKVPQGAPINGLGSEALLLVMLLAVWLRARA